MVGGRSKQVFKTWLAARPATFRAGVEVVAMDGFTGFKTATTEELPDATCVMDPFHVARRAGDALDRCRRRSRASPARRATWKGSITQVASGSSSVVAVLNPVNPSICLLYTSDAADDLT